MSLFSFHLLKPVPYRSKNWPINLDSPFSILSFPINLHSYPTTNSPRSHPPFTILISRLDLQEEIDFPIFEAYLCLIMFSLFDEETCCQKSNRFRFFVPHTPVSVFLFPKADWDILLAGNLKPEQCASYARHLEHLLQKEFLSWKLQRINTGTFSLSHPLSLPKPTPTTVAPMLPFPRCPLWFHQLLTLSISLEVKIYMARCCCFQLCWKEDSNGSNCWEKTDSSNPYSSIP